MDNVFRRNPGRNSRWQHLVRHLHQCGPRPVFEAMLELEAGHDLDRVLERYARIPVGIYAAVGADVLPIDILAVLDGGRA